MADILYISDSSIPSFSANSIHVMKMCQAFTRLGHQVTLLAKNTTACKQGVNDIHGFYGVTAGFDIKVFPARPFRGAGRWYNTVLPFLMKGHYALCYTRSIYAAVWCMLLRRNVVFEVHEPFDGKGYFLRTVFRALMGSKFVTHVVVISSALRDYLIENYHLDQTRIVLAHDGADPVEGAKGIALPGENLYKAGYVGSLLKGKGAELIIPLSKLCPDVDFHVVGGKSAEVDALRAQLVDGQSNVFFHGFVEHSKTPAFLQSFDVLLAPYQEGVFVKDALRSNNIARWMSPLKLFEYMSVGKPVVVSELPVLREILTDREDAIFCPPDSAAAWREAILALQKDRAFAHELGRKGKEKFLSRYTWVQRARHLLKMVLP